MSNKKTKLGMHYRGNILSMGLQKRSSLILLESIVKPLLVALVFLAWVKAAQLYVPALVPVILPACLLLTLLMLLQSASRD